jgi:hypothetical protein
MVRLDQASRGLFMPMERRAADAEGGSVMNFARDVVCDLLIRRFALAAGHAVTWHCVPRELPSIPRRAISRHSFSHTPSELF